MILLALWCGALTGGAADLADGAGWPRFSARSRASGGGGLALAAATAAGVLGCREVWSAAAVEAALKDLDITQNLSDYSPQTVAGKIERLSAAVECRPDDAEAQRYLARLWIFRYRLQASEDLRGEAPGADPSSLWQLTSLAVFHRQVHQFAAAGRPADLAALRNEPVVKDNLGPALEHLIQARRACPLLPEVHLLIAELCGLAGDPAGDKVPLEAARRLSPGDPDVLYQVGLLEFQAGRHDEAYDTWRESLALSPAHQQAILTLVGKQIETPGAIEKLLPPSPRSLIELAQERSHDQEQAACRLLTARAEELLDRVELPEAEKHALRGAVSAIRDATRKRSPAISLPSSLRPGETGWRYGLALAFWQAGKVEEAFVEARRCALAAPDKSEYRDLLEKINQRRLNPTGQEIK